MSQDTLDVNRITSLQYEWTEQWHAAPIEAHLEAPWDCIRRNHRMNFDLWHEEDIARRDDLDPARVREAKRAIDRFNQARNDAVEQIDLWIHARLPPMSTDVPLHSETPGMIVDRLSILALKHYHMQEQACRETATAVHRDACRRKAEVLARQRADLQACLEILQQQFHHCERTFRLYQQYKMYNDPDLNPQIYLHTQK
jgi:hypothetical protein